MGEGTSRPINNILTFRPKLYSGNFTKTKFWPFRHACYKYLY